jgi:hypothetical protein
MSRLQEFVTRIRNTKTQAEERAEYQKEMAAIRESFAVSLILHRKTKKHCDLEMSLNCYLSTCQDKKLILDRWSV